MDDDFKKSLDLTDSNELRKFDFYSKFLSIIGKNAELFMRTLLLVPPGIRTFLAIKVTGVSKTNNQVRR